MQIYQNVSVLQKPETLLENIMNRKIAPPDAIYVAMTETRGRGVFAGRFIRQGETIEVCPVLVLPAAEAQNHLDETRLYDYYFAWGEHEESVAIALGYGSLYNHSYAANADHILDLAAGVIRIVACRPIRKCDEITINYGGRPDCPDPVWFEVCDGSLTGEPGEVADRKQ